MTKIGYDAQGLHVQFPGWESAMVGRRGFDAQREAIRSARCELEWPREILGFRSGLVISGYRKIGVFTHPTGARRLVSMKRGLPLLRVGLDRIATGFDEALLSATDAEAIARTIDAEVFR